MKKDIAMLHARITQKVVKNGNSYNINMTVMALPGILFFLIFSYLPILGIIVAFKSFNFRDGILFSPWIGLKNFEFFFTSSYAFRITFNTLFLNIIFIVTSTLIQVVFAIFLNEIKNKLFVKISNSVMFFPYFVSWVIVGYFTYALLNMDYGLVNTFLVSIGMQPVEWYNKPEYWPAILTLANIWKAAGYGCVIYMAGIAGIDIGYYEAAIVDGAGRWKQAINITLPMLKPLIIMLTLLALGKIFYSDFGMFYNLTRNAGALFVTTDVMDTFVFRTLRVLGDFGMSSAAGLFQSFVGFMLVLVSNLIVRKINEENALF